MTITHHKITNIRGIAPMDQDLPAICLVQGKNEQGKSGFIDSILYHWENGHDDQMITIGADKAEIVTTMADGLMLRAVLTRGVGTERMTKKPGAKKWSTGRAEIDALVNGISYNPLEFLTMKPKEQLALLLKLMPVTVSAEEFSAALAPLVSVGLTNFVPKIGDANGADPLSKIAAVRTLIYDERTGINRDADTQKKHAAELEASLGDEGAGKDWAVEVARLEAELKSAQDNSHDAFATLRDKVDEVKAEAKAKYEDELTAALKRRDETIEKAQLWATEQWEHTSPRYADAIRKATTDLTVAREHDRLSVSRASTRSAATVAKQSHAQLVKQSAAMTEALANLDKLQGSVAARLPIPGIRFVDGVLHDDKGVPWRMWNLATKTLFCLRIARLMGTGFIIIDTGLEVLDPDNYKEFIERVQQLVVDEKMQFILGSITADPALSIGTVE